MKNKTYEMKEVSKLLNIDNKTLFATLRQNGILCDEKYVDKSGKTKRSQKYNLPNQEYRYLFAIKKQVGKNGFRNLKLLVTEEGVQFVNNLFK